MTNSAILDLQSTLQIVNIWLESGNAQYNVGMNNTIQDLSQAVKELSAIKDDLVHSIFTLCEINNLIEMATQVRDQLVALSK